MLMGCKRRDVSFAWGAFEHVQLALGTSAITAAEAGSARMLLRCTSVMVCSSHSVIPHVPLQAQFAATGCKRLSGPWLQAKLAWCGVLLTSYAAVPPVLNPTKLQHAFPLQLSCPKGSRCPCGVVGPRGVQPTTARMERRRRRPVPVATPAGRGAGGSFPHPPTLLPHMHSASLRGSYHRDAPVVHCMTGRLKSGAAAAAAAAAGTAPSGSGARGRVPASALVCACRRFFAFLRPFAHPSCSPTWPWSARGSRRDSPQAPWPCVAAAGRIRSAPERRSSAAGGRRLVPPPPPPPPPPPRQTSAMAPLPQNRSVLLCCMGTRGDVQPFVALALHLQQQRGWRAVLAAVSPGRGTACRHALFVPAPSLLPAHSHMPCCCPCIPLPSWQPPEFRGFITSYGLQHEDIGISLAHAFAASPQASGHGTGLGRSGAAWLAQQRLVRPATLQHTRGHAAASAATT